MARGFAGCLLWAAALAPLAAQTPAVTFAAPDGSRFVLVADAAIPQVHWAVATWIDGSDDPPGLEGLDRAVVHAAQDGTWLTGSRDAERERQALDERDLLAQRAHAAPDDAALRQQLAAAGERCRQLFDATVFPRVLAAAPSQGFDLCERGPVAVLVLTTIPAAIGEVGRLLVERREQQPLRDLAGCWARVLGERAAALAAAPHRLLHAEVLALTMPGHPRARSLQPPGNGWPTRAQALATWAASQRPERTVHVLLGDFDVPSARTTLAATFAATSLPPRAAVPTPSLAPLAGMRHSVVPGVARPTVALGWALPPGVDSNVLAVAAAWLAGAEGRLGAELVRAGRTDCQVACHAGWPAGEARGLFLIEVASASDGGLAELVRRALRTATAEPPDTAGLDRTLAARQRQWRLQQPAPRDLAVALASQALAVPAEPVSPAGPGPVTAAEVAALWTALFAGQPVVVEGRP